MKERERGVQTNKDTRILERRLWELLYSAERNGWPSFEVEVGEGKEVGTERCLRQGTEGSIRWEE